MARSVLLITFALLLCLNSAFAEDEKPEAKETVATEKEDVVKTPTAVVSKTSTWDTLLSGGKNWSLLMGSLGSLLVLAGLGLGVYYFYFLNQTKSSMQTYSGYNPVAAGYNPYTSYQQMGRAMPGGSFSFARVLDMIAMAQETYEKFDFQSLECQKKALCELQQKQNEFGDTGRKISSTFPYMEVLEGLPMPKVIQTYLKEYKDAVIQGKNSSKDCGAVYPKCDFSIKEVFVKYSKKVQKDQS